MKASVFVFLTLTAGYVGLALAPWYLLPICWFVAGTAITGLVSVANDCERQSFVKSKFLNDLVGMVCLLPLWMPHNTLRDSAQSGEWLSWGPLWVLRSLWQWMRANFAVPLMRLLGRTNGGPENSKTALIINLVCLWGFVMIFFPLLTTTLGVWGLFKFYIIPMIIYHFWMSTCLKLSSEVEMERSSVIVCSYPRFVEILGNNFNQIISSFSKLSDSDMKLPSYNIAGARKAIREGAYATAHEVRLSWTTLFLGETDNRPFLTSVHGVTYDLTNFKHPGGPISLSLARDRDATALFEAHHPFTSESKMKAIMKKYVAKSQDIQFLSEREANEDSVFDWEDQSKEAQFSREVVAEVKEYFQKEAKRRGISLLEATKATKRRWVEMILFSAIFLTLVPFYVSGYWFSIFVLPLFAWLYAASMVHDAMHFSVSADWRVNFLLSYTSPWTASPLMWYHQHVIGHHAYPNVPFRDPDLAHAPAFVRLHDSVRWKPLHKFQLLSTTIIWTLGGTLYMTAVPIKALVKGALNRSVIIMKMHSVRAIMHILGRLATAVALWGWQWYVFQGDLPRQVAFSVVPMLLHSFFFMFSTQMNHLTENNITRSSRNYMVHQVVTSHSFSMHNQLIFWFTGGLNLQIEHHMFPTVNHCHLRAISPIVRKYCAKYDVAYHESSSVIEAVSKHFQHIVNMSAPSHVKSE